MNRKKSVTVQNIPITLNDRSAKERQEDLDNGVKIKYEARIYNKLVREYLEEGEENQTMWLDAWADPHYETVYALTPQKAVEAVFYKFPEKAGFVITDIVELEDERRQV